MNLLISAAHAADGAHVDLPFYLDTHFWVGLAFIAAIAVLLKAGYARIVALLDARGQSIRDSLETARRIREEAQALLAEYQRKQRDALQESQDIVARAKNEATKLKAQAAEELAARVAAAERQALERIAAAEEQAKREVRHVAIEVAVSTASRVMEDKLSATQANALIDRAIAELPGKIH